MVSDLGGNNAYIGCGRENVRGGRQFDGGLCLEWE